MNARISNLDVLNVALQGVSLAIAHPARRAHVDRAPPQAGNLAHFDRLLAQLCLTPLDSEKPAQVPFAAAPGARPADCVATVLVRMLDDPDWQVATDVIVPARLAIDLIARVAAAAAAPTPAALPGSLYRSAIVDAAWPRLIEEVDGYLDFCRVRASEARLRGAEIGTFAFTRGDWKAARHAEARRQARCRERLCASYQPASGSACFRVC